MAGEDTVIRNLRAEIDRRKAASVMLAQNFAGQLEGKAKVNAPWEDRTGNARNGLFSSVIANDDDIRICLSHSMEYGVFLEAANDGRFAILKPTIDEATQEIFAAFEDLWR